MLTLDRRVDTGEPETTVTLSLDQRVRSRLRVTLDNGAAAGIFLAVGTTSLWVGCGACNLR